MKKYRLLMLTGIGLAAVLAGTHQLLLGDDLPTAVASAADGKKGLVTFVEGSTKKQKIGDADWQDAAQNTEVAGGERVKTMRRSRAELELAKLDVVRLAPLTTVSINKLYEESQDKVVETDLEVTGGDIWAEVASVDEGATFNISSPIAGAAIRGTVLRIAVGDDNSTELRVYKGEVALTNNAGKDAAANARKGEKAGPTRVSGPTRVAGPREVSMEEWVHIVKQMQKIRISPKGEVLYSQDFTDNDEDEQTAWVQWCRARSEKLRTHPDTPSADTPAGGAPAAAAAADSAAAGTAADDSAAAGSAAAGSAPVQKTPADTVK